MEAALEYNPEAFGRVCHSETAKRHPIDCALLTPFRFFVVAAQVVMLYIDCEVNKTPLKAFVDSGAQMTIISLEAAQKCGLSRLIDNRWSGIAKGVGTAKIVGRIHVAPLKVRSLLAPSPTGLYVVLISVFSLLSSRRSEIRSSAHRSQCWKTTAESTFSWASTCFASTRYAPTTNSFVVNKPRMKNGQVKTNTVTSPFTLRTCVSNSV
jgi:hypothetical protein